jgi:hypothetical protein
MNKSIEPRYYRRPPAGVTIDSKFGPAVVLAAHDQGLSLTVQTERHGVELVERDPQGWWVTA